MNFNALTYLQIKVVSFCIWNKEQMVFLIRSHHHSHENVQYHAQLLDRRGNTLNN